MGILKQQVQRLFEQEVSDEVLIQALKRIIYNYNNSVKEKAESLVVG